MQTLLTVCKSIFAMRTHGQDPSVFMPKKKEMKIVIIKHVLCLL